MNREEAFRILGIEATKDERALKSAYREKLTVTNPEDDPEGFKRLRRAYEEACGYARETEDAEGDEQEPPRDTTPSGLWLERAVEIYGNIRSRQDVKLWKALFDDDVFLSLEEEKGYSKEEMAKALYVSAGIGGIIAQRASVSGAAGGCQAEIGAASAMAAGAVAFLLGGDGEAIAHAAALAMKNLLGLACDPVAGLVEVPCVKRNVIGAVNALTSADLANAGIRSKIPPDEVFDAMRNVGRMLPEDLRETGKGGLAATPTGIAFREGLKTF